MARSTTKTVVNTKNIADTIESSFIELFTPAINAVRETAVQGTSSPEDIGAKAPVNNQLRWFLNTWCQNVHDTLVATDRVFPDGRPNYCLKDRRDYSQSQFMKLAAEYQDSPQGAEAMTSDAKYHRITSWMLANYSTYDVFMLLDTIGKALFKHVAGQDFKPYERKKDTAVAAAMNEANKKKALEKYEAAKALAAERAQAQAAA